MLGRGEDGRWPAAQIAILIGQRERSKLYRQGSQFRCRRCEALWYLSPAPKKLRVLSMSATAQISARISGETKAKVEAYIRASGVKKAYLVEAALQHHLQALREVPEDLVIPSRLVLTEEAMAEVAKRITQKSQPTEALRTLLRGE